MNLAQMPHVPPDTAKVIFYIVGGVFAIAGFLGCLKVILDFFDRFKSTEDHRRLEKLEAAFEHFKEAQAKREEARLDKILEILQRNKRGHRDD